MLTKRTWIMVLLLLAVHVLASAQTTTLKAQWEIAGPLGPTGGPRPTFTVALAQGYTYKLYKIADPASGTVLGPISCTTTQDPFTKTCQSGVPSLFDVQDLQLDLTVIVNGIESVHSNPATVPGAIQAPTSPTNFRLLRSVRNWVLVPVRALASVR